MAASILFADDDPQQLLAYARFAAQRNHVAVTCHDGAEALALVAAHKPSLIVLDINMPLLDGRDVIARLKSDPATSAIPVIIVTGRLGDDVRTLCIRYGADDYLTKPVELRELFAKISRLLDPV